MKKELIIKDNKSPFSLKARIRSFRYAFAGLNHFLSSQHNAIIHLFLTIIVFAAALFFDISKMETIALVVVTGFVWAAELFNTAIEKLSDLISEEFHPGIKFIKDASAAAVLISAIVALLVGMIIFIPKIFL